jgi:hypothetical protein
VGGEGAVAELVIIASDQREGEKAGRGGGRGRGRGRGRGAGEEEYVSACGASNPYPVHGQATGKPLQGGRQLRIAEAPHQTLKHHGIRQQGVVDKEVAHLVPEVLGCVRVVHKGHGAVRLKGDGRGQAGAACVVHLQHSRLCSNAHHTA